MRGMEALPGFHAAPTVAWSAVGGTSASCGSRISPAFCTRWQRRSSVRRRLLSQRAAARAASADGGSLRRRAFRRPGGAGAAAALRLCAVTCTPLLPSSLRRPAGTARTLLFLHGVTAAIAAAAQRRRWLAGDRDGRAARGGAPRWVLRAHCGAYRAAPLRAARCGTAALISCGAGGDR